MTASESSPVPGSRRHILKQGNAFLVMDPGGNIPGRDGFGLYLEDTRHLSRYVPSLVGSHLSLVGGYAPNLYSVRMDFIEETSKGQTPGLYVNREIALASYMSEVLRLINLDRAQRALTLKLTLRADFRDIFEVRGMVPPQRRAPRTTHGEAVILWKRRGKDRVARWTRAIFRPGPNAVHGTTATWDLRIGPKESATIRIKVDIGTGEVAPAAGFASIEAMNESVERLRATELEDWPGLEVDSERLGAWLGRSMSDAVDMFITVNGQQVPAAGLPWYTTLFGRDSLIFGLETVHLCPRMSMDILRSLARLQGTEYDPYQEEEPGKILHELRRGELAGSGQIPHTPYYGSVDATPLFLCLLSEVYLWAGDLDFCRGLYPSAVAAARYIREQMERGVGGFLSYIGAELPGLRHQGWKDSITGVLHPDGSQPEPPIALCEAQGYVYWGLRGLAVIARALKDEEESEALDSAAKALKGRFEAAFWVPAQGTYALALDGRGELVRMQTSNPGHLLMSGILPQERAARVARKLAQEDFFSGWGVRTMSAAEDLYHPLSYHNGSVWPHDTAIVAWGMARHGLQDEAAMLFEGLLDAAEGFQYRLPELFGGFTRSSEDRPIIVPRACDVQAWVAGSPFLMLRALLGLEADASSRRLTVSPFLPDQTDYIRMKSLRLGSTVLDVQVERAEKRFEVTVPRMEGPRVEVGEEV